MNDKLKNIIFNKLYEDLSHVEIIPFKDSIWFIDRENKYWIFEFKKNGTLLWRSQIFANFFELFCLQYKEFQPIISEWVQEVLNYKVNASIPVSAMPFAPTEEILKYRVTTPLFSDVSRTWSVIDALNYNSIQVKEILKAKEGNTST